MADRCGQVRELIPELALGALEGEERGLALDHLASCPECRARLTEVAEVADDLLLLAPSEEPPAGFETRALAEFRPQVRPRRPPRLRLAAALAAVAAVSVGATMVFAHRGDRDLASRYRATLAEVDGKYLAGKHLSGPGSVEVGKVYGYEGEPSWVLVTVDAPRSLPQGRYELELVSEDGRRVPVRPIRVQGGTGSGGQAIPIHFSDVAEVRLVGPDPGAVYSARFGEW